MSGECYKDHEWGGKRWYGEQDENGIDLSLIRENLKLTPLERVHRAEQHAAGILEMNELGRHWLGEQVSKRRSAVP